MVCNMFYFNPKHVKVAHITLVMFIFKSLCEQVNIKKPKANYIKKAYLN